MFIVAEKAGRHGLLLVVTDADILDRKFEQGNLQLDLTQKFYQGVSKTKEEVKKLFFKARHLHLTGKQIVAVAIEMDLVEPERILWVKGMPHAEVVMGG